MGPSEEVLVEMLCSSDTAKQGWYHESWMPRAGVLILI